MLGTVLNEGRYIGDAIKNRSKLPKNYWRKHLALYVFRKDEISELPKALQSNFCPLFWVTNFLLLVSPLWLPVYIFFGLLDKAFDKLEDWVLQPSRVYIKKRKEARNEYRANVYREEVRQKYTYDPKMPNLPNLIEGRDCIETILETLRGWGILLKGQPIPWDDPKFLDNIHIHDREARYFATFRAYHGNKWKDEYNRLKDEYTRREKEREEYFKRVAEEEKERKARRDRQLAKLFGYAKTFCKVAALFVAIPVICIVAYYSYYAIGFCWYWICRFLHFVFIEHIIDVLKTALGVVIVLAVAVAIAALVATPVCRKHIWTPLGKGICWAWNKLVLPPLKLIAAPFVWIGKLISNFLEFVFNFIRMFFSENCPHIEWEEDEEDKKPSV